MAERFISVPRIFGSGDIEEWLQRYEICAAANGWKEEEKALRLPTLLDKEAFAVYMEFHEELKKDFRGIKEALLKYFRPPESRFIVLHEFESRKNLPGESPQEFLYSLKQLLTKAIPDMDMDAREQLLLHRFLSGLPREFSKRIRISPEVKDTAEALRRVKLMMHCQPDEYVTQITEVSSKDVSKDTRLDKLETKLDRILAELSEEKSSVAAIKQENFSMSGKPRCFKVFQGFRSIARYCRNSQNNSQNNRMVCFLCGRTGHFRRTCHLNFNRPTGRVTYRPSNQTGPQND